MPPSKLFIKTKALERLLKEEDYYKQELQDQQTLVNTLKNDPSVDPYDLKKHIEVLQDTQRLFPSLYLKIEEFRDDLEKYLKRFGDLTISSTASDSGNTTHASKHASVSTVDSSSSSGSTTLPSISSIDKVEINTLKPLIDELLEKANTSVTKYNEQHNN